MMKGDNDGPLRVALRQVLHEPEFLVQLPPAVPDQDLAPVAIPVLRGPPRDLRALVGCREDGNHHLDQQPAGNLAGGKQPCPARRSIKPSATR